METACRNGREQSGRIRLSGGAGQTILLAPEHAARMTRLSDNTARTIGLSATAIITMVALMAMAPGASTRGAVVPPMRAVLGEGDPVRLVAAAVVAAARELVRVDQSMLDTAAPITIVAPAGAPSPLAVRRDRLDRPPLLIESALDLPPPGC
jgi:hypothetical protein